MAKYAYIQSGVDFIMMVYSQISAHHIYFALFYAHYFMQAMLLHCRQNMPIQKVNVQGNTLHVFANVIACIWKNPVTVHLTVPIITANASRQAGLNQWRVL